MPRIKFGVTGQESSPQSPTISYRHRSGASDVGQLSDLVARKLKTNSICRMSCLALAGADQKSSIEEFKKANLLMLDGCPIDCGKKKMDKIDIKNYQHMRITDLGYAKGQTQVNEKAVFDLYTISQNALNN